MRLTPRFASASCALALALVATACGGDDELQIVPSPIVTGARPSVSIDRPVDGATLEASDVVVSADIREFEIVDKLGEPPAPREGHVHFYLDVDPLPTTAGKPAVPEKGTYHAAARPAHTWRDVPAGTHTFAVQLVNNDHTPLSPPVTASVTVTVSPP